MVVETTGAMLCKSARISVMGFLGLVCFRKPYFTRKALLFQPTFGEGIVIGERAFS
jgi:hypothetical protein